jgi:nitrile hydratase
LESRLVLQILQNAPTLLCRARVVREPRRVLHEMGLDLPESVAIRVWDTTAETRYMVLPVRPARTEGWSEGRLAEIVTREAMICVALVTA